MVHKILIRDASFLSQLLEVLNRIRINSYGYGLLQLLKVRVFHRFGEIVFFAHSITSHIAEIQLE